MTRNQTNHHANDRTNHRSFLKFLNLNSSTAKGKFRGLAGNSTARGKLWALVIMCCVCSSSSMSVVSVCFRCRRSGRRLLLSLLAWC